MSWEQDALADGAASQQLQLVLLYLMVAGCVLLAYVLGWLGFSGAWPVLLLAALFHLWRTRVARLTRTAVRRAAQLAMRRRAMSGCESAEWLNFLVNRWWAFSAESIQAAVKRSLDYQLQQRKPAFLQSVQLERFTLGEDTPCVRELHAFEATEDGHSLISACWANAGRPPKEVYRSSQYRLVVETQLELHCEQFRMDFATRLRRLGVGPSVSFGQLSVSGRLQLCVQLDLTARFPHVASVTAAFKERPDVWFSLRITRAVNVAFVPVLRQWLRRAVEESLTAAMVDPGELVLYANQDVMSPAAGAASAAAAAAGAAGDGKSAGTICGVVTVTLKIAKASAAAATDAAKPASEDAAAAASSSSSSAGVRICTLSLGAEQRLVSREFPAGSPCTQAASFFVRDLATEELHVHLKSKSLFGGVMPVAKWAIPLREQPLKSAKVVEVSQTQNSARLGMQLEYTELPDLQLETVQTGEACYSSGRYSLCGALLIKVHSASNLLGMDRTGESDPYCVVFTNRRKVGSTPYVKQTKSPKFDCQFHTFVADYSKTTVSFFLYDWDGGNAIRDDFLGACHIQLQKDKPALLFHQLPLGFTVAHHGQVSSHSMGNLLVSIVFRPVASVAKSEAARANSGQLTDDELMSLQYADVSPNRASISSDEGIKKETTTDDSYSMNVGSFMAKGLGVMQFHLAGAKDLMAMDRGGTSDPFVELRIGEELLFKSKVSKATLKPRWNEWVTTRCPRAGEQLKIVMWDKDRIGKDFLGELMLTLDELKALSDSTASRWFNLVGKGVRSGQVELGCKIVAEALLASGKPPKTKDAAGLTSSSAVAAAVAAAAAVGPKFTVHSARNLCPKDSGKACDAYVKVTAGADVGAQLFRSRVEKKSLNPYWGQQFSVPHGMEPILFSVLSKNSFGKSELLGTVELSLEAVAYLSTSSEPVWYPLLTEAAKASGDSVPAGELSLECQMPSDAAAAVAADGQQQQEQQQAASTSGKKGKSSPAAAVASGRPVTFHLHAGRSLMAADFGGTSDPFVRVSLGNTALYKSRVVKRSLAPQWNEEFTVPVPKNHAVTFTVMDHDAVGKDDFLGEVSLDPVSAAALGQSWYQLKGPKVKSGEILVSCRLPPPSVAAANSLGDADDLLEGPEVVFEEASEGSPAIPQPVDSAVADAQVAEFMQPVTAAADAAAAELATSPSQQLAWTPPPPPPRLSSSSVPSHVELTIVSGSSLMAADLDGTSDPYVVATVAGRQVHKTRVRRSTLNPVWRESFSFQLPDQGHLLRLAVYDKDMVGKDDFLGEISLTRDNLTQMCSMDESLLKLSGKKVTSGHLLVRCRSAPAFAAADSAAGNGRGELGASAPAPAPDKQRSFSEDLQQVSPPSSLSVAGAGAAAAPDLTESRSVEAVNLDPSGTFQCDLLSVSGLDQLSRGERIYLKIKGDTSRRGIGGRDLYKSRSYDLPQQHQQQGSILHLDTAESFRLVADTISTVSFVLKGANRHQSIDISSHSVANLVARSGGGPVGVALPGCGASVAVRLTRLAAAASVEDVGGGGGGGGGSQNFGSLLRRRSKKSAFRSSSSKTASAVGGGGGSNV